jgi:hypothetical protein
MMVEINGIPLCMAGCKRVMGDSEVTIESDVTAACGSTRRICRIFEENVDEVL